VTRAISRAGFEEVADVVPGARTVLVSLVPGLEPSSGLQALIDSTPAEGSSRIGPLHTVAVTYDGPDVDEVAQLVGVGVAGIAALHSGVEYTVAFIGFQPGFPYLIGLPRELELPRLATPRARVPAGSVAIAGEYTGIYPSPTPGGWHLIGRTDELLFDATAASPSRFAAGDRVRFVPA
jgi:KipI family sensor histidine kinase inhibitor